MKTKAVYIYLATTCTMMGIILTFVVLFVSSSIGIDLATNMWIIAIPVTLTIILNITLIELYDKYKKKIH